WVLLAAGLLVPGLCALCVLCGSFLLLLLLLLLEQNNHREHREHRADRTEGGSRTTGNYGAGRTASLRPRRRVPGGVAFRDGDF
ncbi:MAG: hypothetical protein ACK56S_02445, partial [Planctomycetota bacterium]